MLAILDNMENELIFLETRVKALILRLSEMDRKNRQLSDTLQNIQKENADLQECLAQTIERIEALIARLPEAEDSQQ